MESKIKYKKLSQNEQRKLLRSFSISELRKYIQVLENERLKRNATIFAKSGKRVAQVTSGRSSIVQISRQIARAKTILLEKSRIM